MNYGAKMISRGPEKSRKTADLIPACPDCAQCVSLKLYDGLTAAPVVVGKLIYLSHPA